MLGFAWLLWVGPTLLGGSQKESSREEEEEEEEEGTFAPVESTNLDLGRKEGRKEGLDWGQRTELHAQEKKSGAGRFKTLLTLQFLRPEFKKLKKTFFFFLWNVAIFSRMGFSMSSSSFCYLWRFFPDSPFPPSSPLLLSSSRSRFLFSPLGAAPRPRPLPSPSLLPLPVLPMSTPFF